MKRRVYTITNDITFPLTVKWVASSDSVIKTQTINKNSNSEVEVTFKIYHSNSNTDYSIFSTSKGITWRDWIGDENQKYYIENDSNRYLVINSSDGTIYSSYNNMEEGLLKKVVNFDYDTSESEELIYENVYADDLISNGIYYIL